MIKDIKINKYLFITIIIAIISIFISSFFKVDELAEKWEMNLMVLGWCTNILFLWSIYSIYKMKKDILDFNIIFLFFFYIFCNGQVLLYTFGIPIKELSVLKISTGQQIIKEIIYFYFSLLFFQIGSMLCIKKEENIEEIEDQDFIKAINALGILILIVSIVPYMYILLPKFKVSILYGYSELYNNSITVSGVLGYISKLFIPSMFLLLFTCKNNKTLYYIIICTLIILSVMNLIIGARGDALSIIVTLIIFYNLFVKKFNKKNIVKLLVLVLIIMLIIPVIASFRSSSNKNISGLLNNIKENLTNNESNFIVKTISELGYTMHAFILTEEVVPNIVSYKHGESYLASILMLIPSQLLGGYSFASKAALDTWLQNIHKMPYGPGFSIVAETYYNFGYYGGIIFSIVIGFLFSKLLNLHTKDKNKNILLRLLSLIFLYNSLILARFPFHNTVRNIVYMYIVPYWAIIVIYNTIKKRGIKKV